LLGPSLFAALVISPLLALGFLRRAYGGIADAASGLGLPKLVGIVALASAIALIPSALTFSGLVTWFNALAVDAREQDVECKVGSTWHRVRKRTDLGWHMSYTCGVDGETLIGSIEHLPKERLIPEGQPVRFRAARGRFGIWVRRSDPLPLASAQ
jgi:hypothetical protein